MTRPSAAPRDRSAGSPGLADPARYADGVPHAEFARLRRTEPVAWIEEPVMRRRSAGGGAEVGGDGFWAITRYASVNAAARTPKVFSSAAGGPFLADPRSRADLERTRQLLAAMDAPEHTRVRRAVTGVLTGRAVRAMRSSIERHAARIVERVVAAERFDVVADLAAELPLLVLTELLGIPPQDRGLLLRWSNNLVGFDDPEFGGGDIDVFKATFGEAFAYVLETARAKRRAPADDLVSALVRDGSLTDAELCHLWILLVVAGNETTRHLLSGSLDLLADRPDLRAELAGDPAVVPPAVEEMLRWLTPIMQFRRTAVVDTEVDGRAISAGDKVVLYFISANRDEAVFARPDRVDLRRSPNPQLAFGAGPHFCLGAHLARLEAEVLFEQLRPHLPGFRRLGPAQRLASNFMNGIKSMPATFAPVGGDQPPTSGS